MKRTLFSLLICTAFPLTLAAADWPVSTPRSDVQALTIQEYPLIDLDPQGFLTVWVEIVPAVDRGIYIGRISPDGTILSGQGTRIGENVDYAPAVAFNGKAHLVAWWGGSPFSNVRLMVCRVGTNGDILDTPRVVDDSIDGIDGPPAVASDGDGWLIAWTSRGGLRTQHVRADGSFDPAILVATDPPRCTRPAIAFGGGAYWVVWEQRNPAISCPSPGPGICLGITQGDIYFARLTAVGQMLDPVNGLPLAVDPDEDKIPAVVEVSEDQAVVVWGSNPLTGFHLTLRSAALGHDGQILSLTPSQNGHVVVGPLDPLGFGGNRPPMLTLAGDGHRYRLVWPEFAADPAWTSVDIHRATLDSNGMATGSETVVQPTILSVSPAPNANEAISPGSLRFANGRWYLAYLRAVSDPVHGTANRAFVTTIDDAPPRRRAMR